MPYTFEDVDVVVFVVVFHLIVQSFNLVLYKPYSYNISSHLHLDFLFLCRHSLQ